MTCPLPSCRWRSGARPPDACILAMPVTAEEFPCRRGYSWTSFSSSECTIESMQLGTADCLGSRRPGLLLPRRSECQGAPPDVPAWDEPRLSTSAPSSRPRSVTSERPRVSPYVRDIWGPKEPGLYGAATPPGRREKPGLLAAPWSAWGRYAVYVTVNCKARCGRRTVAGSGVLRGWLASGGPPARRPTSSARSRVSRRLTMTRVVSISLGLVS